MIEAGLLTHQPVKIPDIKIPRLKGYVSQLENLGKYIPHLGLKPFKTRSLVITGPRQSASKIAG